jgi:zinc protease
MTIGSQEDLDAASLDDVKDFFQRFYGPSNASLAIAGDFHPEEALELVQRYFGDLPPSDSVARVGRQDSLLSGRIDIEMRDKVTLPRLYIAWPAPPEGHPDDAPLELYQAVMSDGLSARLHRSLVYEKQIAQHAFIHYGPSEIAGQLLVQVTAAEGHSLDEVEAAVEAELENIHRNPPTDEEIARSKNRIEATHYRQLARIGGFGGRADQLNHFNVFESDAGLINTSLDRCLAVQREDILRVAKTYVSDNQVRLRVLPEAPLSAATTNVDRTIMPPPTEEPVFTPPLPARDRLPNGMGVTVVEQRGMPIVAFGILLGSGAAGDPADLPGLAGMVGAMLPEGAAGKSSQQVANDFEFIGARLSVDSRREYSLLSTETLSKHWSNALEMTAQVLLSPEFPEHELERLRREHLTDLRRSKDEPNAIAERLIAGLVYPKDSGYGHPMSGTESSVRAISRDDLLAQFRRAYRPENAHLLVVGDVDREEVMRRAADAFGAWDGVASESQRADGIDLAIDPTTIFLVDRPGAPQSVIRAAHSLVPRLHPDYFPLLLGNYVFGGQFSARLNQNLRQDKGYSYGYMSSIQWLRLPSMIVAGGSVQSNATGESVYETLKEFREVNGERPITAEELSNAKDGLLRAYPASFERPASVLGQLVAMEQFGLPDDYFRTVRPSIDAVTLDDVHRVSKNHIRPGNLQVLVVGDRASVEGPLSELGLPIVHLTEDGEPTD